MLVRQPNRWQTWRAFNEQRKTYLELAGNAYVYAERDAGGKIKALHNLRPDRMYIIAKTEGVVGYGYLPPGKNDPLPLLVTDVAHSKYPNPNDELEGQGYGMPPLLAAARDADTDNNVTEFIKLVFERGAMPMGMLRFETSLTDEDAALARRRFTEVYGSYESWVQPMVVDKGGSYEKIGMTFDELGFDVLDARNEARILSAFGVPPILLGTRYGIEHGTYSNYSEARTQFWQDVLVPELRMFEDDDRRLLEMGDGSFLMYDLSVVPALQRDTAPLIDAAHKLWQMGVPANQALASVGLPIEEIAGGDVGYVSKNVQAVGSATAPPAGMPQEDDATPVEEGAAEDVPKGAAPGADEAPRRERWTGEQKALLWKAMDDIALHNEGAFRNYAATQFELDRREMMVLIAGAQEKALRQKATIDWQPVADDALQVIQGAGERWRSAFIPVVRGVVTDVSSFWNVEAGLSFDVTRLEDQAFFTDYSMDFWDQISETSRSEIGGVIQRGIREGWSISEMQSGLDSVFQQWIGGDGDAALQRFASGRLQPWRTELIARTESTKATSWGAWQTYRGAGVAEKEWISTSDARTRPTHVTANRQVRKIDEPFEVGGHKMMHPGDGSLGAPVSEIGNCRCSVLPVLNEE